MFGDGHGGSSLGNLQETSVRGSSMPEAVTAKEFGKRFVELCIQNGNSGLPRRRRDRHILLKGVVSTLDKKAEYAESQVNQKLKAWLGGVGRSIKVDHVILRRYLVDEEYLGRSRDGSRYWVATSSRNHLVFDPDIGDLDLQGMVCQGRDLIERKKEEYLAAISLRKPHGPGKG